MHELAALRAELVKAADSRQASPAQLQEHSAALADLRQRLDEQGSQSQQLKQAQNRHEQQTRAWQEALTIQQRLTQELQHSQQSLSDEVDSLKSDHRQGSDLQETSVQPNSSAVGRNQAGSQHDELLSRLGVVSAEHSEQLKQCQASLDRHAGQIASSEAFQQEAQEVLQQLQQQHPEAARSQAAGKS